MLININIDKEKLIKCFGLSLLLTGSILAIVGIITFLIAISTLILIAYGEIAYITLIVMISTLILYFFI